MRRLRIITMEDQVLFWTISMLRMSIREWPWDKVLNSSLHIPQAKLTIKWLSLPTTSDIPRANSKSCITRHKNRVRQLNNKWLIISKAVINPTAPLEWTIRITLINHRVTWWTHRILKAINCWPTAVNKAKTNTCSNNNWCKEETSYWMTHPLQMLWIVNHLIKREAIKSCKTWVREIQAPNTKDKQTTQLLNNNILKTLTTETKTVVWIITWLSNNFWSPADNHITVQAQMASFQLLRAEIPLRITFMARKVIRLFCNNNHWNPVLKIPTWIYQA